jgi:Glycosyl transferases group 1
LSVMDEHAGFLQRRREWVAAYGAVLSGGVVDVLHLHGAAPLSLIAAMAGIDLPRQLLYTPLGFWDTHQSRWRLRTSDLLVLPIRRLHSKSVRVEGAVSERQRLPRPRDPVALVHPPLAPAFLAVRRSLDPAALVVASAGGKWRQAATSLAQLGVLAEHGASDACTFQWSGECDALSTRVLQAAGIRIYRDEDAMARAKRLSRAWAFVSAGPDHGFPWHIAEAMACGVPVVALDTPLNRRLVLGGLTGFLCRSAEEMLAPVLALIRHPDLRRSLGDAGRQRIREEFGQEAFARRIRDLYGMHDAGLLDEALEVPRLRRVG